MRLAALFALALSAAPLAAQQMCHAKVEPVGAPLNQCIGGQRVTIAAAGDVLLHRPLQRRGYSDPLGFYSIWQSAAPIFQAADIAYVNLEGPTAPGVTRGGYATTDPGPVFDDRVYSSYPMFNYHPRVIGDLMRAGIDVVSTANNHALDRGPLGADRSVDQLRAAKLPFTGTIKAGEPRAFFTYTGSKLGRIAWLACSYSTNGLPDPKRQMLMCYQDRAELLGLVRAAAARTDIAAVIVTPHWGNEYQHSPSARQRTLAAQLVDAGATAVIGTHPHVLQGWETRVGPAGNQGLTIYSTGNFVSGQVSLPRRTGGIAWLELCQPRPGGDLAKALKSKLVVGHAGWVPIYMVREAAGPRLLVGDAVPSAALAHAARHWPENGIKTQVMCRAQDATLLALQ